jgi:HD superfamily phosphohydrolase
MDKDQRIRDPVHNLIKFALHDPYDPLYWKIIQHPAFQRLRRIKQLGFSEFVFPGATHTRFSHSIGAFQMARRMFEAFERNEIFARDNPDHIKMRGATLAAVLLHDVGHGPFSHVFEEISHGMNLGVSHEQYTRSIITETEIGMYLEDAGLKNEVIAFFDEKPPGTAYTTIVSSQLDADRLDFLARDRYFTGIKVGHIDHEWLFDTLRIENVPYGLEEGETEFTFVVLQKGLNVIEDYISAYLKLYEAVYFHKTTRGVQFLVEHALKEALKNLDELKKQGISSPIFDYFTIEADKRFAHYLRMDDGDIVDLLKQLSAKNFGLASEFATRFLTRVPLSCFEPSDPNHDFNIGSVRKYKEKLTAEKIWFHLDISKSKGFKQYEVMDLNFLKNIMIKVSDSQVGPIGAINPALIAKTRSRSRFYFLTKADLSTAAKLWTEK